MTPLQRTYVACVRAAVAGCRVMWPDSNSRLTQTSSLPSLGCDILSVPFPTPLTNMSPIHACVGYMLFFVALTLYVHGVPCVLCMYGWHPAVSFLSTFGVRVVFGQLLMFQPHPCPTTAMWFYTTSSCGWFLATMAHMCGFEAVGPLSCWAYSFLACCVVALVAVCKHAVCSTNECCTVWNDLHT